MYLHILIKYLYYLYDMVKGSGLIQWHFPQNVWIILFCCFLPEINTKITKTHRNTIARQNRMGNQKDFFFQ